MPALLTLLLLAGAAGDAEPPLDSGIAERVGVRLVLIDAVVVDRSGRTVPDLALEDFEVNIDGTFVPVDTLDTACPDGSVEDPRAVRRPGRRQTLEAPDAGRRMVIVVDYAHLDQGSRVEVLEQAKDTVLHAMTEGDEVMVVALTNGLRIEQTFTGDPARVVEVLDRMEYDISLWGQGFPHLNEFGFFTSLEALFDVLTRVPGHKAVLLYSNHGGAADENDLQFASVSAAAANARCSVYSVHAAGLISAPG